MDKVTDTDKEWKEFIETTSLLLDDLSLILNNYSTPQIVYAFISFIAMACTLDFGKKMPEYSGGKFSDGISFVHNRLDVIYNRMKKN
jgi:hypothetical protein